MIGLYLPFGIFAREHVAGTVIGEGRGARVRADQTHHIPKAISRVNRAFAARVRDFGERPIGIVSIQRGFTRRVIMLGHMVKTIDQITVAVACGVGGTNQILHAVPGISALIAKPVYLASQITNFVIQVVSLVMSMPTCIGERLCFICELLKNVTIYRQLRIELFKRVTFLPREGSEITLIKSN